MWLTSSVFTSVTIGIGDDFQSSKAVARVVSCGLISVLIILMDFYTHLPWLSAGGVDAVCWTAITNKREVATSIFFSEVTTSPNVFVAYVSGLGSLAVGGRRGTRPAYRGSEPFAMTVLEFLA